MSDSFSPLTPGAANALNALNAPGNAPASNGENALGQSDFLRLLTVQLQQQDPLEPVDNKEMLAQMAQFSGLAATTETNASLGEISAKLDALIEAQRQAIIPAQPST
ncbi:flagellar hook assembly protein FlgD [Erythrobacter sp. MTPC3]|uniref:flagellar hook assembly protein FlgD n=1 Tax=Erythrobacter sp. MTPC3 TaxID=3056564 RepID=UPI0036F40BF9